MENPDAFQHTFSQRMPYAAVIDWVIKGQIITWIKTAVNFIVDRNKDMKLGKSPVAQKFTVFPDTQIKIKKRVAYAYRHMIR